MTDRVVFLDRDGVINRRAAPHQYIISWESFHFLPGAQAAIALLNRYGYRVVIVTNQRGIARRCFTLEDVRVLHERMCLALAEHGARIDDIYVCPHNHGECDCRKPKPGLFLQAERDFSVDPSASWMIGDSDDDIEAGRAYGVKTVSIGNGVGQADFMCGSLLEAATLIVNGGKQ